MYEVCLLHAQSDRALRAMIAERLSDKSITMMEWLLLGVVAGGKTSGLTMSDIAEALHVTLPQVTALVNKLLPLKLIKQKSANNDRRSRVVTMTSKGQLTLDEANAALDNAMGEWFDGLSTEQRESYSAVLKRLATSG
jgi:DNA-binding MarR family transcriptional regulator